MIADALAQAGCETIEATNADEALAAARKREPEVAVLDVHLPGVSGYEICRRLRESFGPALPIIFLSGERVESYDRVAGLLLGADDYIVKPFAPDELVARVQRLAAREAGRPGAQRLTKRELDVLRLLAEGKPQREIAAALVISPKTVGTHIEHILSKLGVKSRAQAVAVAYREGFVEPGLPVK
jgi:DNA-binding NarL/FixJ family response regulator